MKKRGEQVLLQHRRWARWQKIVTALACVVVFCTTYALILPAITMEKTQEVLNCQLAVHQHSKDCYDKDNNLICGEADFAVHIHGHSCYDEEGQLVCKLPEIQAHTHTEDCYKDEQELVCEIAETPGHQHDDSCYEIQREEVPAETAETAEGAEAAQLSAPVEVKETKVLVCGKEEGEGAHAHDKKCYEDKKVLTCKNQAVLHRHDEKKCYEDGKLTCGRLQVLEHIHGNACMETVQIPSEDEEEEGEDADPDSDTEEDDEEGDMDLEEVDDGQVEDADGIYIGDGEDLDDYDEFLDDEEFFEDFGDSGEETEALTESRTFKGEDYTVTVSYGESADIPEDAELSVREILPDTEEYESYYQQTCEALGLTPMVPLDEEQEETAEEAQKAEKKAASEKAAADESDEEQIEEEKNFRLPVMAEVVDDTQPKEDDNLQLSVTFARFFDISFVVNGQEIEPAAPVRVSISYTDAVEIPDSNSAGVIHFADSGVELIEAETSQSEEANTDGENAVDTFEFTQDSFSVTGTIITENWIPYGGLVICCKDSSGNYYAIAKDGTPVPVEYDNGTVYCENGDLSIVWTFNESTDGGCYFVNADDPTKYLAMNQNGLNITSQKTAIKTDYDSNRGQWFFYYDYRASILSGTTRYYLTYRNGAFRATTTQSYVYMAKNVVYKEPEPEDMEEPVLPPNLLDPSVQPSVDAAYEHNKTIDYLGDGASNPNTTLTGEDLYRLSLDMTGIRKPVDLLLVVDASGSMKDKSASDSRYTSGMAEVIKFLNGVVGNDDYDSSINSFNSPDGHGFISEFFQLNSQNRLAITAFGGYDPNVRRPNNIWYVDLSSNPDYRYTTDAWLIKDWNTIGSTYSSVPVAEGYYPDSSSTRTNATGKPGFFIENDGWVQGTNYSAGLMLAREEFDKLGPDDGSRIRVMVFLSDGKPTYSIVPTTTASYPSFHGERYVRRGQGQNRYYRNNNESTGEGTPGTNDCFYDSQASFDKYHDAHPEVINYSIAFKVSMTDSEVLQYMGSTDANRTNGANFKDAEKHSDIMDMILGVFRPKDVSIIDRLSDYVEFHTPQPDVQVTMTRKNGGTPVVLWEGYNTGSATSANTYDYLYYNEKNILTAQPRSIVRAVTYQDGQISVQFDEHYTLDQDFTYALAFNVRATDKAYDTYTSADYDNEGESGTDFGSNVTSSGQDGLRSNAAAVVRFKNHDDQTDYVTAGYKNPVIQVDKCDLKLIKLDENNTALSGAKFELYRQESGEESFQSVAVYTAAEDGTLTIPHEVLTTGEYKLKETQAPDGYLLSEEEITFAVERGMIADHELADESDWTWSEKAKKVGSGTNWPKNQFYHYKLEIKDHPDIVEREILIQKTDAARTPLEGAAFTLYRDVADDDPKPDDTVEKTLRINGTQTTLQLVPQAANLVSGTRTVTIDGEEQEIQAVVYSGTLLGGTYYLVEDAAPPGYNTLEEPVVIEVTADADGVRCTYKGQLIVYAVDDVDSISSVQVLNTTGYTLPETGGMGTTTYTIGGAILMSASLLCGFSLRRKRERRTR